MQDAPDPDTAFLEYRCAAVWGVYIGWLITPVENYGLEITAANTTRMVAAVQDFDALGALGEGPPR